MTLRLLLRALLLLLALYGGLCILVFLVQRRLLYFPDRVSEAEALRQAQGLGLQPWRDGHGGLLGWRLARAAPAPVRILVFHGNAGNALGRIYYFSLFDPAAFDVVLFEYPGYGGREGSPSEKTLVAAGREAFLRLREEGPVILLGESLGSGVAAQLAAASPGRVQGLLLVTPFACMAEVAAHHYPWLPVKLLMRDRWDNVAAVRGYGGPVAVLVAGRDEVVGSDQGYRLAKACAGPMRLWEQSEAGHNSLDIRSGAPPWKDMTAFVTEPDSRSP